MYLTLQTLLFECLNVIPGQLLGFAIIYYVPVVCARLLCIWERQDITHSEHESTDRASCSTHVVCVCVCY